MALSPDVQRDTSQDRMLDFTFVENAVQANIKAVFTENKEALNQVYNVAFGERTTLNQLVNYIKEILGELNPAILDVTVEYGVNRIGDIPHSLASIEKAINMLGYYPSHNLEQGLHEAMRWYWENLK